MLKEIVSPKNAARFLLNHSAMRLLSLCAVISLVSSSTLAMIHPRPALESPSQQQTVRNVTVTVRATGCEPANGTQTAGQINLTVINQTGGADLFVQFYDGQGNILRETAITQGATQWSETFDLKAGSYTIVAGRNQAWTCHLTVQ